MAHKVAYLTIKVTVDTDDDSIDLDNVISDLDYEITSMTDGAKVIDTQMMDREIQD